MISPLPGATDTKPGSATRLFFGVQPALVDNTGMILEGATEGNLVIVDSWPGQARTVYGDHERYVQTYFSTFRGMYFTGDGRSEEHTSELQSRENIVCRLLLQKKNEYSRT